MPVKSKCLEVGIDGESTTVFFPMARASGAAMETTRMGKVQDGWWAGNSRAEREATQRLDRDRPLSSESSVSSKRSRRSSRAAGGERGPVLLAEVMEVSAVET